MEIKTKRLLIVPLSAEHYKFVCEYALDKDNNTMMVFFPKSDEEEVMDYLVECEIQWKKKTPEFLVFAIIKDSIVVGEIELYFEADGDYAELGWLINKDYRGQCIASEAALAVIDYFQKQYGIKKFIAQCDDRNTSSKRVMEKIGMKYIGILGKRKNRLSEFFSDECLYELVI